MQHAVPCSRCNRSFTRGVTRVRRFIVFHFCSPCQGRHADECEAIMAEVAGPIYQRSALKAVARVAATAAAVVLASALFVGCAMRQPVAQKLARPIAQLSIPVSCIDKVVSGLKKTTICEVLPKKTPNAPDQAVCNGVVVEFHCTKVVPQ